MHGYLHNTPTMEGKTSLIYKHIFIYRMVMNIIYTGSYKQRFKKIVEVIAIHTPTSILELCFGDTIIAEYCNQNNINWTGIDINKKFVASAIHKGYDANCQDLNLVYEFKETDLCIISGSLYHFSEMQLNDLIKKIISSTSQILISEPIINLSDSNGLLGYFSKRQANAGNGNEHFRYNKNTLLKKLNDLSAEFNLTYQVMGYIKKDMIVLIQRNGSN